MDIIVTAHKEILRSLTDIMLELYPEERVIPIYDSMSAVQYAYYNHVDMVYADISTPPMDIVHMGGLIRKKQPQVRLYMIADSEKYVKIARDCSYDGYYLRPVTAESLKNGNIM